MLILASSAAELDIWNLFVSFTGVTLMVIPVVYYLTFKPKLTSIQRNLSIAGQTILAIFLTLNNAIMPMIAFIAAIMLIVYIIKPPLNKSTLASKETR